MAGTTAPTIRMAPGRLPGLGHALQLRFRPLAFVTALRAYGDVALIGLGTAPAYVVNSPELVWQMMTTDAASFGRGVHHMKLRQFIGEGLFLIDGEQHRRHRPLVRQAFRHERIVGYVPVMQQHAREAVASWRDGQVLDVNHFLHGLTLDIVTNALFTEVPAEAAAQVQRWLPVALHGAVQRALAPVGLLERLPTPGNRRFATSRRELFAVADDMIAHCRAAGEDADTGGVVAMLVAAGMTDQQILDEVLTLYIGGTETAANTLGWALLALARHPEVEQRLHAEIDRVLAGRVPGYEDLARLPYTLQVVKETMRLYPQPWLNSRRTAAAATLGGYRIPAGADVFFSPYALHRDPRHFPDPESFDPDRWAPGRVEQIPRHAWLPFSWGVRRCLGDAFATHEMHIILATVAGGWRLRTLPGFRPRVASRFTLGLTDLQMRLEHRP